jgi:hypothetical protein
MICNRRDHLAATLATEQSVPVILASRLCRGDADTRKVISLARRALCAARAASVGSFSRIRSPGAGQRAATGHRRMSSTSDTSISPWRYTCPLVCVGATVRPLRRTTSRIRLASGNTICLPQQRSLEWPNGR